MIRTISNNEETLSIISGFDRTLYDAYKSALERGQRKAWMNVLTFVHTQMIYAFSNNDVSVMQQLFWLPSALYATSTGNSDAANLIAADFSSTFNLLGALFRAEEDGRKMIDKGVQRFYLYFNTLLGFYHYLLHHPDELVLRNALNQFVDIDNSDTDFDIRYEIHALGVATQAEKMALRDREVEAQLLRITLRQAKLALISWITYLYILDKLSTERAVFLFNRLELHYYEFEELLADIVKIRSQESRDYLGIGFWDYMERPTNEVYSPPQAYDWILYGACVLLLREEMPDFDESVIIDNRENGILLYSMREKLTYLKTKQDKMSAILGWQAISAEVGENREELFNTQFEEREQKILTCFARIKVLHEEEENRKIVAQALDANAVKKFLESLVPKWVTGCLTYPLFEQLGVAIITNNADDLMRLGGSTFLEQQKKMFILNGRQEIYNSSDLGAAYGRAVDETFIELIVAQTQRLPPMPEDSTEATVFDSVVEGIDAGVAAIEAHGFKPDMIIVPGNFTISSDLRSSSKYKGYNHSEKGLAIGTYDNIPLYRLYAKALASKCILLSFKQAMSLAIYENDSLYANRLHLALRELTTKEIDQYFEAKMTSWKTNTDEQQLTDEQAKLRIAASLIIEIWSTGKFDITEPKAVTWCQFSSEATRKKY